MTVLRDALLTFFTLTALTAAYIVWKLFEDADMPIGIISEAELDTGDVLVLAFESMYGKLVRVFGGTMWTHASLVIRRPDGLHIAEMLNLHDEDSEDEDGNTKRYKHFNVHPFERWKRLVADRVIVGVSKLAKPVTQSQQKAIEAYVAALSSTRANLDVGEWTQTMVKFRLNQKFDIDVPNVGFCTECIARTLQFAGVLNMKTSPRCYRPNDFSLNPEFRPLYIKWLGSSPREIMSSSFEQEVDFYRG